ncbi:glucosylglycerate hydrolase [Ornithinicoccus halotolerans]|uniref:glucosylglycerate hydrolase n=1 Tax=Ornithinicoccus halotolerans TaxID=1748220 RepID=UPI001E58441C|nr:glycogen debranching protein [Ornithinicoccus halotolerans]
MGWERLAASAGYVLRGNDLGTMTTAAPALYPHQWSWDAAFVSVGLATVSVPRAVTELDTLLAAQWGTGMVPHIVFSADDEGYFPGPQRWGTQAVAAAPEGVRTSGICQPPVHAIAAWQLLETGRRLGGQDRRVAEEFCGRAWPRLLAWHRWLATARDPEGTGRVTIHHGWESGMDNSPRWDGPYARVEVGPDLPPYTRRDTQVVADASQRPSDREYDRYLWLIEEMRRVSYDDARVREAVSFAAEDVLLSAILALASDVLADLGEQTAQRAGEVAEMRALADRCRGGVAASIDPATGLARDRDLRTGEWLATETLAGFAPLLCGAGDHDQQRHLLALLDGPRWCGHPALAAAVPPSTSPESADFRPREYWRGPQWPVTSWLFSWAFAHHGWVDRAAALREESLRQLSDGRFGEYYEPFTGEALGSEHQSWTAAVTLDWLCWPES